MVWFSLLLCFWLIAWRECKFAVVWLWGFGLMVVNAKGLEYFWSHRRLAPAHLLFLRMEFGGNMWRSVITHFAHTNHWDLIPGSLSIQLAVNTSYRTSILLLFTRTLWDISVIICPYLYVIRRPIVWTVAYQWKAFNISRIFILNGPKIPIKKAPNDRTGDRTFEIYQVNLTSCSKHDPNKV